MQKKPDKSVLKPATPLTTATTNSTTYAPFSPTFTIDSQDESRPLARWNGDGVPSNPTTTELDTEDRLKAQGVLKRLWQKILRKGPSHVTIRHARRSNLTFPVTDEK
ncbi:uncharacterized protein BROUX77_005092 [Berkeleyomyces rouxiae]|uniref:uncharacterized protein n=1 Tax=Berkeleyomyces rouxiae TaxID=2035830 RepID=UPI003B7E2DD8